MQLNCGRRAVAVILMVLAASAQAEGPMVLNFDDVDASQADIPLDALNPYAGLTWTHVLAYTAVPGFPGFDHGIVSGPNAAYSGGEMSGPSATPITGSITGSQITASFNVLSAWVGAGYYDNLAVTFQGWSGGALLFTRTVTANATAPQLVSFGFLGVDTLTFSAATTAATTDPFACGSFNCTQFTVDDLSVVTYAAAVPEPAAAVMLLAGLVLMGGFRFRPNAWRSAPERLA